MSKTMDVNEWAEKYMENIRQRINKAEELKKQGRSLTDIAWGSGLRIETVEMLFSEKKGRG